MTIDEALQVIDANTRELDARLTALEEQVQQILALLQQIANNDDDDPFTETAS